MTGLVNRQRQNGSSNFTTKLSDNKQRTSNGSGERSNSFWLLGQEKPRAKKSS